MTNPRRIAILIWSVIQIGVLSSVCASDLVLEYPSGWRGESSALPAASPIGVAVVAYKYKNDDPRHIYDRSLVIQARPDGTTYTTEFDGKVFSLEYSQSGEHILAHQVGTPDLAPREVRVHLLGKEGTVLWSKTDPSRAFFFSTTGDVVYAWWPGDYDLYDRGRSVEIFDLAGNSVRTVTLDAENVRGVVVPESGAQVIFATTRSIQCLNAQQPITTAWRLNLEPEYPDILSTYIIDPSRFATQLERSAAMIVNLDGRLEYTYDPKVLGTSDPVKEPSDYAAYRMYEGPAPGTVTLFDGSSVTYTLSLASGELTARKLDTARPQGFKVESHLQGQRMVLSSPTEVIVRAFD